MNVRTASEWANCECICVCVCRAVECDFILFLVDGKYLLLWLACCASDIFNSVPNEFLYVSFFHITRCRYAALLSRARRTASMCRAEKNRNCWMCCAQHHHRVPDKTSTSSCMCTMYDKNDNEKSIDGRSRLIRWNAQRQLTAIEICSHSNTCRLGHFFSSATGFCTDRVRYTCYHMIISLLRLCVVTLPVGRHSGRYANAQYATQIQFDKFVSFRRSNFVRLASNCAETFSLAPRRNSNCIHLFRFSVSSLIRLCIGDICISISFRRRCFVVIFVTPNVSLQKEKRKNFNTNNRMYLCLASQKNNSLHVS